MQRSCLFVVYFLREYLSTLWFVLCTDFCCSKMFGLLKTRTGGAAPSSSVVRDFFFFFLSFRATSDISFKCFRVQISGETQPKKLFIIIIFINSLSVYHQPHDVDAYRCRNINLSKNRLKRRRFVTFARDSFWAWAKKHIAVQSAI
jgi:hypothetical protein